MSDLTRYCAGCGSVGPVDDKFRDCCPDGGSMSVQIPRKVAEQCRATFRLAISGQSSVSETQATAPDVLAQVEKALRKCPLVAQFLDQGFWHAHHVDVVFRHDGQDRRYEADWIKDLWYIVRRRGLTASSAGPVQNSDGVMGSGNGKA